MDAIKLTPGPWAAEYIGETSAGPNANSVYEITNGYTRIAENIDGRDAFLIAAAPELYAALTALRLQALQSDVNRPANEWGRDALEQADAALIKARGDQP